MGCGDCNKKKKRIKATDDNATITQLITPCNDCDLVLGRCVSVPLPHGFIWTGDAASVVASPDLSCCITECTAVSETTLCGTTFPSEVVLLEIRLTGIIQYVVNVPVVSANLNGTCVGSTVTNVSLSDSLKVDNVVCHLLAGTEFDCPASICDVTAIALSTVGDAVCGDAPLRGVGVVLEFTLPNVCPPL